jgi:hypothetical protein
MKTNGKGEQTLSYGQITAWLGRSFCCGAFAALHEMTTLAEVRARSPRARFTTTDGHWVFKK